MTTQPHPIPALPTPHNGTGAATPLAMTFVLDGPNATAFADRLATVFGEDAASQPSTNTPWHNPASSSTPPHDRSASTPTHSP